MSSFCEKCPNRAECVSAGWMSPNNVWFPNVVMIRPATNCPCRLKALVGALPERCDDEPTSLAG